MKQLSNAFIQALMDDEREYLAYATVQLMDDTVLQLTNEEIWSGGFSYEEAVSSDDSFTAIGSAIMGSATLIINNIYDDYTDYDFTNARVSLSVGMMDTDQVLSIGEYRVDDTSYNGATIQLTLLDNMTEFDRPYSISTLTYPTTLSRIVYDACLNCGISAAHSAINFPNDEYTISTRPTDENVTFRDIISWSAALAGCFAKMNPAGELEFKWFDVNSLNAIDTTVPTFHPWETGDLYSSSGVHYLYSLTSQNICTDDVIITGITIRVKTEDNAETQSDVISFSYNSSGYIEGELENDGSEYIIIIENNSFITTANARTIVTYLGTQLVGLRFRKLNISQVSDPSIEAGDVAIVTDRKLNSYKIFVTRNVFHIGSSQNIVCGADTPSRSNSSTNSEITKSYIEARKLFKKSMSATDDALNSAILAAQAAREAQESADSALTSARFANNSANSALTQLSVVEDVAGTLRWISEHGTFNLTEDTTVQAGTVYFIYQGGDYVPIAQPDPSANPSEEGWYILDVSDSQASYIMAHLAVTNAGLWVLPVNGLATHPLVDSNGDQIVDSDNNPIVDFSEDPQNADGYKVLLSNSGMSIYNGEGAVVANYGVIITLGEDGRPRLRIKPTGMALLNASDSEVFEIRPDQTDNISKEATVVTYQTDSSVMATSYTISDTSTSTAEVPYIELSVNGGEPFAFSTGVTATATQGVGVTVTVTSTGVSAILDQMRYETIVDTYTPSTDTSVDETKTYYSKDGDIYTEVIPVGDENPSTEGWYELSSTTTTSYYPCTMTVTYSAISDIRTSIMDMIGKIDVDGEGNLIRIINNSWTSNNRKDTFVRAINNTTGTSVAFGVGSGGVNHGVWSTPMASWIIYASNDGYIRIPKTAIIGSTSDYGSTTTGTRISAGNILLSKSDASDCYITCRNKGQAASFVVKQDGTKGLWDTINQKWIIYTPKGGGVVITQNLKCSAYYRRDGTSVYRKYNYGGDDRFGYGSGAEVFRVVTKYTGTNSQGWSFLIGNGGYAVGSDNDVISTINTNIYLAGGTDASSRYLRSYPVYNRTSNNSPNVYIDSNGTLCRSTSSSIRYKHDVEYLTNEENSTIDEEKKLSKKRKGTEENLSDILDIPVVKFKFNEGYITGEKDFDYSKPIVGLIADDVASISPDCATYIEDEKGEKIPESWNSEQLLIRMLYVVQQQDKRIAELEERVKALEGGMINGK